MYVPADLYTVGLPAEWGRAARDLVAGHGGTAALCAELGIDDGLAAEVAPRVDAKLEREPIEDLRLDFEDGYGDRGDEAEDAEAVRAARTVAEAVALGVAPAFVGLRFKCFEAPTRRRGVRTLDLFLSTLLDCGGLPDSLVITFPKVSTVSQVEAMVEVCAAYEAAAGLPTGRLRFEIQVETPQLIVGNDGRLPVAAAVAAGAGRVTALHYGTYDYSASLGVSAAYQSLAHPAADFAKEVMQVAVAGTGVMLADGSTNVLPVGSAADVGAAWSAAPQPRAALPGTGLLPGLGHASRSSADPLHRQLRLLPRGLRARGGATVGLRPPLRLRHPRRTCHGSRAVSLPVPRLRLRSGRRRRTEGRHRAGRRSDRTPGPTEIRYPICCSEPHEGVSGE